MEQSLGLPLLSLFPPVRLPSFRDIRLNRRYTFVLMLLGLGFMRRDFMCRIHFFDGLGFKRVILLALVTVCMADRLLAAQPKTLEIGAAAPDFSLPGVDGKTYTLADFKDAKFLVIVFTCNHCPTAQAYEDRIKQIAADYKDRGVVVVAIQPNDPASV